MVVAAALLSRTRARAEAVDSRRGFVAPTIALVAVVVVGMVASAWIVPSIVHVHGWYTPGDIWVTYRAAQVVSWGGEGILYQHSAGFITLPGMAVALAPVALVADTLGLSASYPYALAHPAAWLALGPAEMALGAVCLFPLHALAMRLGIRRSRRMLLMCVEALLTLQVTLIWGHPEDVVALAFGLWGLVAAYDGRWRKAAVCLAVALVFQPLVVLVVPIVAGLVPVRRWLHAASLAVAPSVLLLVAPLAHDPRTTLHALVDQPTFPTLPALHATPWLALAPVLARPHEARLGRPPATAHGPVFVNVATHVSAVVAGGPSRLIAIALAVCIGVYVARRRPSLSSVLWLAGFALALRGVFESVLAPYYLVPALAIALVLGAGAGRLRLGLVAACVGACTYVSYLHASPWAYYLPMAATLLGAWAVAWPRRRAAGAPDAVAHGGSASVSGGEPLATA